jgi:hypothetical protein
MLRRGLRKKAARAEYYCGFRPIAVRLFGHGPIQP